MKIETIGHDEIGLPANVVVIGDQILEFGFKGFGIDNVCLHVCFFCLSWGLCPHRLS